MEIQLVEILKEEKQELEQLLLAYFKEIDASKIINIAQGEIVDYPYLDMYWTDENRTAFFIRKNGSKIGFVLLNDWVVIKSFNAQKSIAEFYIHPNFRRQGIGRIVAFQLFKQYPCKWEIRQFPTNLPAVNFWRTTINEFTKGDYLEKEHLTEDELLSVQLFKS